MKRYMTLSLILSIATASIAQAESKAESSPGENLGWKLAVQAYTFNRFTFFEAVDKAKSIGLNHIEGFAWQKVSPDHGDAKLNHDASAAVMSDVQKKLKDANVKLIAYYVSKWGDESNARKIFTFAKEMGIEVLVSEPAADELPMLDKLTQEFEIKLAIHNHPKHPDKDDYTYWQPEGVLAAIKPYGKYIGCCADTGHWIRSGLDPVESLKKYKGRLFSLHLKDVNEKARSGHDVPFGTGVGRIGEMLAELKLQKFKGVITIEYEHKMEDNASDVRRCVRYFNSVVGHLAE